MSFFLIGLGNPGPKYAHNRHNIGYIFLDWLVQELHMDAPAWKHDMRTRSEIVKYKELVLCKPLTYMNESGSSVGSLCKGHDIGRQLVVAHDDLDLPLGQYKLSRGKGPLLHGGLNSIEHHLKTKDFWRLRIGVDRRDPTARIPGIEYVLQDFYPEELASLPPVFAAACEELKQLAPDLRSSQ